MTFSGSPCNGAAHVFWYLIALYCIVPTSMHGNIVGLQVKKKLSDSLSLYTRGVQYVMKTAQYIPKFYIYTLHNYFH